ncbi:PKD domain-containing protein [Flavihumibacter petaseus]|uniref:PKD/Chitinase domain-containing protein n=1 Tax=Flavihumibacter petaseus NBRC 106054 TaxID=1220578 RepID=A0A0E9N1W3_9BACT|nr:PKD domain-containing protein [Flavihumibacter petaseus]GAO43621.1 hypothetical protein FPE01S_02_07270 [Flavihumibacter petaseus NBRC 106054]
MKALLVLLSVVSAHTFHADPEKNKQNLPPQANAGEDIAISTKDFVQLDGTASREPDGIISRYHWVQVSGTPVSIANPQAAITAISGASKGTYTFRLSVTDEKGSVSADEVKLVVKD